VDITEDESYERPVHDTVHPSTIQPSPQDFVEVYNKLAPDCDGIVSVHISNKLSGTINSALQGKSEVKDCPVEVIDSEVLTMSLGLVVMSAARFARTGASFEDVVKMVKEALTGVHLMGLLDTLKYLLLGGRIGKAKALMASLLNVKPLLTLKDGEVMPVGQARSRNKGIDKLFEMAKSTSNIGELSVVYNTTPDEATNLADRIAGENIIPRDKIIMTRVGPMLGVHMGPGALLLTILEKTG
jgi:DegV family protein with EDD domain